MASTASPRSRVFPEALQLQACATRWRPIWSRSCRWSGRATTISGSLLDYWDDQHSATVSGLALARVLGKFMAWRDRLGTEETCLKHVNVLAHSMGNRVLPTALASWAHDYGAVPALFRNLFMAAADVANDVFAPEPARAVLAGAARNVVVYHAADDFALRSSKVVNLPQPDGPPPARPHRPGRTPTQAPANVVAVDCDDFNSRYDRLGHSYLLGGPDGRPGAVCATWSRPCDRPRRRCAG